MKYIGYGMYAIMIIVACSMTISAVGWIGFLKALAVLILGGTWVGVSLYLMHR